VIRPLRISQVGLRGVVGQGLTANHVIEFACAFGTFLEPASTVVVGRDPRASSQMLRQGVIASLLACGHDVVDLGVVSTPVIQHAIQWLGADGGVSIGASHNTAEWNALKFFGSQGIYLNTAQANELLDIYHLRKFRLAGWQQLGRLREEHGALDYYLEQLARVYDLSRLRRYRVVIDCCNGTSSLILRRLINQYGFDWILINERLEGVRFAHDPATTADTVALQLAPLVRPLGAQAGFLFDVDSDRVALATEQGEPVSEEFVLPLLADFLLPRQPGKLVITNLSTTALVDEVARRHGGEVLRVPVGRQAAIDALASYRPDQVAVAGEGTGAVMMPQFRFIYDGIASMLAILTMMEERQQSLSEILASYPKYYMIKAQFPLAPAAVPALLMDLRERYADAQHNTVDGLRVDWPDRWFHVRVSQTEPILRVICEGRDEPPVELFRQLAEHVRRAMS